MDCYTDLLIRIRAAPDPGRPYPVEAVVDGSAQHQGGTLSIDRDALLAQVLDPDAYGRTLSQALLSPPIQRAYERARSRAEARCGGGLRLRLMIDPDAGELQPLRWERLLLSRRHQTVAAGIAMGMPFSRYTALDEEPPSALDTRPVLMLIAVANPADSERWGLPAIDVAAEVASLWEGLSALPDPGALALSVLPGRSGLPDGQVHQLESAGVRILPGPTGAESLGDHMRRFHVVHLIAHGTYRQDSGGGQGSTGLLLESADGTAERVADDRLASRWAAAEPLPRLVYLAACESAAPADSGAATFAGLGPRLVQSGVPAVVAMQDKVPMALSSALTRRFFQSLLTHGQVDRALAEARWLVAESRSADWSIPVLYTRLPEGLLLAPDPLRQALAAMAEWSRDELASRAPPLPVEVARAPIGADSAALARLAGGAEAGYDLEEAIRELLIAEPEARRPFAVLSGGEGSGKSVQLMALVGRLAEEALKGPGTATWLPLVLDLSDWRNREPLGGVEDRLMRALKRFWPELDQQRWRALCSAPAGPRLLFMLDNAQALEESERSALYKGLEELARRAPRQRFLLVCDTWGSGPGCAGELGVGELLVVKRLRFRRVEVYLRGLKDPHGEGPDESAALLAQVLRERRLFDLAGLPWLLFHMLARARQGRPPHTRNAVLEDYVASALAVLPWAGGVRGRARESLRALALELMQRRCSSLPLERALELLASVRGSREYRLQDMQDALVEARMLIRVGEDCIRFSYPGLQSFSCADALSAAPDWRERIDDVTATLGRLSRLRWWSDTLVLFAGMTQDIDLLIGSILAGGGAGAGQEERVFLAARCIEENDAARLDPMLRGQTVAGLLHLSNADYEPRIPVRIRAVRALQRLQDASAIPQLVRLALEPNRTNWMGKRTVE